MGRWIPAGDFHFGDVLNNGCMLRKGWWEVKASVAAKGISRIIVCLHPGQLSIGNVVSLALTDFNRSDAELDEQIKAFVKNGGVCIYDGPPSQPTEGEVVSE